MPLPETLAAFVAEEAVAHHKDSPPPSTLPQRDVDYLASYVPLPEGSDAVWRKEKVVRDLKHDLKSLQPRVWENWTVVNFAMMILRHPWYDQ